MNHNSIYVLIHSPLVGSLTWTLVADQLRHAGLDVYIPLLLDSSDSLEPIWKQHAESVSQALAHIPRNKVFTLVALVLFDIIEVMKDFADAINDMINDFAKSCSFVLVVLVLGGIFALTLVL